MDAHQAWQATLGQLEMEMPKASFETWVRNTEFLSVEDSTFKIGVHNAYARDWLESRLASTVERVLTGLMGTQYAVQFIVALREEAHSEERAEETFTTTMTELPRQITMINPRYTLDSFVVGSSNRMAHAACLAVAEMVTGEQNSRSYNPLFLYGGVGLGKTHLLHAIGNATLAKGLRVLYVSSEEFTNDLIKAIQSRTTAAFRERYRQMDVLLIDDIQFIAGKESTQEEFFHTFNTLHGQDKQIIISSDRPPKAMVTLEERLRSRFEWGLTVDIQPPDLETRLAILRSKAERARRNVPDGILELIARQIQSNIRELEGALTRVLAFSDLSGQPVTEALVNSALADLLPQRSNIGPEQVIQAVAEAFNISLAQMRGSDRSREIALPRQVAMYLLREESNLSLPQVGELLGGRDHTTAMHAIKKVADMIERDDKLRRQVIAIRERLYGRGGFTY
ncbi:MAG: chromosomal replication initiator protein DnaA [Anaerolineae bacterium]|nr:chromosomal replication initiator protein DnaA [Anaerolineae bacterium]